MQIFWTIPINTDDGYTIFEAEGEVEFSLDYIGGEPFAVVDDFEIIASRCAFNEKGKWEERAQPAYFSASSPKEWKRVLFLKIKQDLEKDQNFQEHAFEVMSGFDDCPPYKDPNDEHRLTLSDVTRGR